MANVLDASVIVPWFVKHELTSLTHPFGREPFIIPSLTFSEVANTIWKYKELGEARAKIIEHAGIYLRGLATMVVPDEDLLAVAGRLAVSHQHSVYDCIYLSLALSENCPVITADRKMALLAKQAGIGSRLIVSQANS